MRREHTAFVVHQRHFRALHLALPEGPAKLAHGLDDAEQSAGRTGVRVREHAAMRVNRQLAAEWAIACQLVINGVYNAYPLSEWTKVVKAAKIKPSRL